MLVLCLLGAPLHAVQYDLIKGQQFELCRAYERNLNSFSHELPMACERKFDPDLEEFWQPNWETLNPAQHMDLIRETLVVKYKFRPTEDIDGRWNRWRPKLQEKIRNGEVKLSRTEVDVNHDGINEIVYRFADRPCDPSKELDRRIPSTYRYFVMDSATGKLSSDFVLLQLRTKNLFFYKGRAYVDTFDDRTSGGSRHAYKATMYVFELGHVDRIAPLFMRQVCDFKVYSNGAKAP